jgi:hypothetical protein
MESQKEKEVMKEQIRIIRRIKKQQKVVAIKAAHKKEENLPFMMKRDKLYT